MKSLVVVNPKSSNGRTGKAWQEIASRIREAVGPFDHVFTTGPGHATLLARDAVAKGYEMVVSVGGDGTHSETANGFFDNGSAINPQAIMGIVTSGTGGDFRRTFDMEAGPLAAISHLAGENTRTIDVGRYTCMGHDGALKSACFVNILSFGIAGLVDHVVNHSSKALGGKASFFIGTLRATAKFRAQTVTLKLDDGPARDATIHNMAVANGRFFGGGMMVAPQSDPSDGQFDVVGFEGMSTLKFLGLAGAIYKGTHLPRPGVTFSHCRKLEASSNDTVLLDVDGEQPGLLPLTVELIPGALKVKV